MDSSECIQCRCPNVQSEFNDLGVPHYADVTFAINCGMLIMIRFYPVQRNQQLVMRAQVRFGPAEFLGFGWQWFNLNRTSRTHVTRL